MMLFLFPHNRGNTLPQPTLLVTFSDIDIIIVISKIDSCFGLSWQWRSRSDIRHSSVDSTSTFTRQQKLTIEQVSKSNEWNKSCIYIKYITLELWILQRFNKNVTSMSYVNVPYLRSDSQRNPRDIPDYFVLRPKFTAVFFVLSKDHLLCQSSTLFTFFVQNFQFIPFSCLNLMSFYAMWFPLLRLVFMVHVSVLGLSNIFFFTTLYSIKYM